MTAAPHRRRGRRPSCARSTPSACRSGPGQPPAFLEALGRRTDWEDLRIGGALLTVLTDLFTHPNVHYLSGFYGPLERLLRDSGANIGFAPGRLPPLRADPRRPGPRG